MSEIFEALDPLSRLLMGLEPKMPARAIP